MFRFFLILLIMHGFAFAQNSWAQPELDYFKNSYSEARSQFLQSTKKRKFFDMKVLSFPHPADSDLTTDVAWIKTKPSNNRLLVFISGLHGIEGHVGSAIQSWMIETQILENSNTDYLFIHALNPYGFKNNRRVNENNVDLNRNFIFPAKVNTRANPAYKNLNSFLNPTQPVQITFLNRFNFLFSALHLIFTYSTEILRQSILLGQYEFPNGIFYGGDKPQYQLQIIDELSKFVFSQYGKLFAIDLHTGYGQKNKLHFLANDDLMPSAKILNRVFDTSEIDFGNKKNFYKANGDLITYLEKKASPNQQVAGLVFEFGTLNSQSTLGSIESLRRVILENQNFHYKSLDAESDKTVQELFKILFYPSDEIFKHAVLSQMKTALNRLNSF